MSPSQNAAACHLHRGVGSAPSLDQFALRRTHPRLGPWPVAAGKRQKEQGVTHATNIGQLAAALEKPEQGETENNQDELSPQKIEDSD